MTTFVATIDLSLKDELKKLLQAENFELKKPPYTHFAGKGNGVSVALYTSGKLTVQGKNMDSFVHSHLVGRFVSEAPAPISREIDMSEKIGVDEAGKGDFFGPLCIGAVQATRLQIQQLIDLGVCDSKRINDKMIAHLAPQIRKLCPHAILKLSPIKYNELYGRFRNLNTLLGWAHATVIADLYHQTGCEYALIDQFAKSEVVEKALADKNVPVDLHQRTKAEEDPVVAAASILARDAFVQSMNQLSEQIAFCLPKGASRQVITAGIELAQTRGADFLDRVGKAHFKTKEDILKRI